MQAAQLSPAGLQPDLELAGAEKRCPGSTVAIPLHSRAAGVSSAYTYGCTRVTSRESLGQEGGSHLHQLSKRGGCQEVLSH